MDNMNFRIQDLTKTLIPGIVVFFLSFLLILSEKQFTYLSLLTKDTMAIWLIIFLATVYTCGFFIDLCGSFFERIYYHYREEPAMKLLNDKSRRIKLSSSAIIIDYICDILRVSSQSPFQKEPAIKMFKCANVYKDYATNNAKERVLEYYYSMILSRNLSTSLLISFLVYLIFFLFNISKWTFNPYSLFIILAFLLFGYRWTTLAYYYSRQVFYAACEPVLKRQL